MWIEKEERVPEGGWRGRKRGGGDGGWRRRVRWVENRGRKVCRGGGRGDPREGKTTQERTLEVERGEKSR